MDYSGLDMREVARNYERILGEYTKALGELEASVRVVLTYLARKEPVPEYLIERLKEQVKEKETRNG